MILLLLSDDANRLMQFSNCPRRSCASRKTLLWSVGKLHQSSRFRRCPRPSPRVGWHLRRRGCNSRRRAIAHDPVRRTGLDRCRNADRPLLYAVRTGNRAGHLFPVAGARGQVSQRSTTPTGKRLRCRLQVAARLFGVSGKNPSTAAAPPRDSSSFRPARPTAAGCRQTPHGQSHKVSP